MLRRPGLRSADLENAVARPDEIEQQPKTMLGRAPRTVLPSELAVQVRERGVDSVVRLVPALLVCEDGPRFELAELRREAGSGRVEEPWDPVLDGVASAAPSTRERRVKLAATGRTADVGRELHGATILGRRSTRAIQDFVRSSLAEAVIADFFAKLTVEVAGNRNGRKGFE
jgi:hypothetical protein